MVIWLIILVGTQNTDYAWNIVMSVYQIFCTVSLAVVVFLSARHIHVHSKQLEKLGYNTNYTLLVLLIVIWSSYAVSQMI